MIWIACAVLLSLTVIYLLQLTGIRWPRSVIGGVVAAAMYAGLYFLVIRVLEILIAGWLWG